MKKTSTRLAVIGVSLVLGAFAIAFAQHDFRNHQRDSSSAQAPAASPVTPISIDAVTAGESVGAFAKPIVRGNNDPLPEYENPASDNPLRANALPSLDAFDVVPASAQESADAPPALPQARLPSSPSEWPGRNDSPPASSRQGLPPSAAALASEAVAQIGLPAAPFPTAPLPSLGFPPTASSPTADVSVGEGPAGPALPASLPAAAGISDASTSYDFSGNSAPTTGENAQALPHLPVAALPETAARDGLPNGSGASGTAFSNAPNIASPPTIRQPLTPRSSDMSDTQRAAMQATDLSQIDSSQIGISQPVANTQPGVPTWAQEGTTGQSPWLSSAAAEGPNHSPTIGGPGFAAPPQQSVNRQPPTAGGPVGNTAMDSSSMGTQGSTPTTGTRRPAQAALPSAVNALGAPSMLTRFVSDEPGNPQLDGSQSPNPQIEKIAPEEIQVGKKATFVIVVRNIGNAAAHEVTVVDKIPRGAVFSGSEPAVNPTPDGLLVWNLGVIEAGDSQTIRMNITPEVEGEMGSTASVHFVAQASVRTTATKPKLLLSLESLPSVLIGAQQQIIVNIENNGSGIAHGVTLEVDLPPQLQHESGMDKIGADIGDLHPGQSKRITNLALSAVGPGKTSCIFRAVSQDGLRVEESIPIEITSPKLIAGISGPKRKALERPAKFVFSVQNVGTATATNLEYSIRLPPGVKYLSSNVPAADYDQNTHALYVLLPELPANGQPAPIEVTVLPVEQGDQALSLKVAADLGMAADATTQLTVEGHAELDFTIEQDDGSIETGTTTTYTVTVHNVGSMPDRDVRLAVKLPQGSDLVGVAPSTPVNQNVISFAPVKELPVGEHRIFRFEVRHLRAGTQVVQAQLSSMNLAVGVVKEQHTYVYDDSQ
ncbi:MAG: DUF11 domain-containing protein [Planctomycetales bacterium]|nr:DUF11 domain-containing protein [Planctomycetales bacterium]